MDRGRLIGILLIVATTATWGGAWVIARYAADTAPALWMAVGRFVFAAAVLGLAAPLLGKRIGLRHDRRTWLLFALMGLTGAVGYNVLFLLGIERAPASDGAVITPGLAGLSGALLAWRLDGKRPRTWALVGGLFSLAGALTIGSGALGTDPERLVGQGLFVVAAITWGLYTVYGARLAGKVSAVESVFWATVIATLLLIPFAWVQEGPAIWPTAAWANMAYLGAAATAIGFVTWYLAVQRLGADGAGPGLGLVPAFGVTAAVLFLDEALAWQHILGAVLVVAGIALSSRPDTLHIRVERHFGAPVETVWARVGDFKDIASWSDDLASSRITAGSGLVPGTARFCEFAKPVGNVRGVTETLESVREHGYTYRVDGLDAYRPVSHWDVHHDGEGARLVFHAEMQATLLGHVFWPLTKRRLLAGMENAMNGLDTLTRRQTL